MADAFDEAAWKAAWAAGDMLSFVFLRRGEADRQEDPSRWIRDKWVWGDDPGEYFALSDFVNDVFWVDRDPYTCRLLSILQGDVYCEDQQFIYADEPGLWDPRIGGYSLEWAERLEEYNVRMAAKPSLGQKYTVIFGWEFGCPPPNCKRNSEFVIAIDAVHAELLVRGKRTDSQTAPLVGSVHKLWVHPVDSWELDVYTTPNGQPLEPPPPPAPRRKRRFILF
ncbi:MAG TPA: hypothetical protein VGH44_05520 [Candidatus Saccharimonadia bacterium]